MKNSPPQAQQVISFNFEKASPEALDSLLNALNAEVDQAVSEKRIPTLNGAFGRFGNFTNSLQ